MFQLTQSTVICSLTLIKVLSTSFVGIPQKRTMQQGFQYFSNVPVLHYLQVVLFIKTSTFFMNILHNTL